MQLVRWYGGLLQGDLGRSILLGQDVMSVTLQRLPVTIALSAYALVITLVLGLASGILAALRHNTWIDQAAMMFAMLGVSIPNFCLGLLMIILFAVHARLAADRRLCRRSPTIPWAGCVRPDHAGDLARPAAGGPAGAHHALDHAGGAAAGLRPHGARQGPAERLVVIGSMRCATH